MNAKQFEIASDQADALLAKVNEIVVGLEKAKQLFDELPNEDEIKSYAEQAGSIAASLDEAAAKWNGDDLPHFDDVQQYAEQAASIPTSLEAAAERWETLPTIDAVQEMATAAAEISGGLAAVN